MKIKNSRAWVAVTPLSYGYALLATGAAFFVRYELHPLLQTQLPILFFILCSILVAYKLGWKPAALSSIVGVSLSYYFFIPPFNSFELPSASDLVNLTSFTILFLTILFLIERLQRERYQAILVARVSDSRMRIMAKLSSKIKS
jgi:K+-sensing histidine kinase KdpD